MYFGMCSGICSNPHSSIYEQVEVSYWKLMRKPTNYVYNRSCAYPGPRPRVFRR